MKHIKMKYLVIISNLIKQFHEIFISPTKEISYESRNALVFFNLLINVFDFFVTIIYCLFTNVTLTKCHTIVAQKKKRKYFLKNFVSHVSVFLKDIYASLLFIKFKDHVPHSYLLNFVYDWEKKCLNSYRFDESSVFPIFILNHFNGARWSRSPCF